MGLEIEQMFAFIAVDDDGDEGIPGVMTADGWLPLVGADIARIDHLRPIVENMAKELGRPIKLVRFSVREELEVVGDVAST